ncbi:hypothetical protein SUGI_0703880 [Cryptomeria japonica]|nr:hypothetical protein SUGI_0703880 [Cryptomeria japonica]
MPKGISELVALRVLRSNNLKLSFKEDGLLKLEDVAKLTCLQELRIEVKHAVEDGTFAQQLEMRHLSVKSTLSSASAQPPNLCRMRHLQTLKLKKFAVPNWVCALHDLAHLELANCECRNYPELQALPHLEKLILDGNRSCKYVSDLQTLLSLRSCKFWTASFSLGITIFQLYSDLPDLLASTNQTLQVGVLIDFNLLCSVTRNATGTSFRVVTGETVFPLQSGRFRSFLI